jgi:hypothetical protein
MNPTPFHLLSLLRDPRWLAATATAAGLWFGVAPSTMLSTVLPTVPSAAPLPLTKRHDDCRNIAYVARHAALTEAHADYLLAVGKCMNEGGGIGHCLHALYSEYREARDLIHEQHRARLDVCRLVGGGIYNPRIDPKDFTAKVTNRYFPLIPGRTLVYQKKSSEGTEVIRVTTRPETIEIAGVECAIVHDVVTLDGEPVEDTDDWYAQDRDGNVWYFGEIARNFEDGLLDNLDGSWRTGKDGAKPGILMQGTPRPGKTYRQEFLLGEAEDVALILSLDDTVEVPAGKFTNCLRTEDWTPLEPDVAEHKFYAPGIGLVLEVNQVSGARTELVEIINP